MIIDKERSPEQIHDYFDLLRWRKTGSIIEIQTELIETAEYLLPINKKLSSNQEAISLVTESLSSLQKKIASVRNLISSVNQESLL